MIDNAKLTNNQALTLVLAGISSVYLGHSFIGFIFISSSLALGPRISTTDEVSFYILSGPMGALAWVLILLLQTALGPEQLIQGGLLATLSFYSFSKFEGLSNTPKLAFNAAWVFSSSSAILFSLLENWEAATIFVLFIHLLVFPNLIISTRWNYPVIFLSLVLGIRYVEVLLSFTKGGFGNEIAHAHELWIMFLSAPVIGVAIFYILSELTGPDNER